MLEIIFDIILSLLPIVAFYAGYIYRDILLFRDMNRVAENLDKALTTKIKEATPNHPNVTVKDIRKLKHEIHNGTHYFFIEKDDQFVCQGQSLVEAAKNYTLIVGKDNLGVFKHLEQDKEYCFVNSECLEFINE